MSEWVEHDGKGMPVAEDCFVLVRFRDRSPHYENSGSERMAGSWHSNVPRYSNWHHEGTSGDIVAYRVVAALPIPSPEPVTPPKQGS